jgi:hypothetical protein
METGVVTTDKEKLVEANTVDAALRVLIQRPNRRGIVTATLGGLLVERGIAGVDAKRRGKGKKNKKKRCKACPATRKCGEGCCPAGQVCGSNGQCVHPTCCSGDATCGPQTSSGRLCCITPQVAKCCCDSSPGARDGFVVCCTPGVDCDRPCPSEVIATGGQTGGPANLLTGVCAKGGSGTSVCPG